MIDGELARTQVQGRLRGTNGPAPPCSGTSFPGGRSLAFAHLKMQPNASMLVLLSTDQAHQ